MFVVVLRCVDAVVCCGCVVIFFVFVLCFCCGCVVFFVVVSWRVVVVLLFICGCCMVSLWLCCG